jgi:hypothetical protein
MDALGPTRLSLFVMPRRSTVVLLGVVGAVIMALALGVRHRQSPAPDIAVSLVGYTNRGGFLVAELQVTNKGLGSVIYGAWGSIPFGWVKAQTTTGWTDGRMAPPFTGSILVVPPKSSEAFAFALPGGTLRWRCGFCIRTANVRERTACRLFDLGVSSRVDRIPICGRLLDLLLDLLPSKTEPEHQFQSALFEVGDSGHNPASPVDGGIPLQSNTWRPYPAATDPRC